MELQAVLVLCGLGVAGAAVLLLMGLFSVSGTSYEEAIAQQRKATTELLALADNKGKPKKNVKKASKKQAKKERNKDAAAAAATASEPESEVPADSGQEDDVPSKPHVEFTAPVVVDVPRDAPPNVKMRKRGKDPKVKPILVNKDDPSCVSDVSAPPTPGAVAVTNHFEDIQPKDEFELLHSTMVEKAPEKKEEVIEKKETKGNKQNKGKQPTKPAPEPVKEEPAKVANAEQPKEQRKGKKSERKSAEESDSSREEVVPPLNVPQPSELTTEKLLKQALAATTAAPPAPAPAPAAAQTPPPKGKKKKQEPNVLALIADGSGVNVSELVRVVREAALSRTEIQILTDALLNKQHDQLPMHSDWSEGPNDPLQKMKKQLAEKEKALADEVEASQALHAKLKELRTALNSERARAVSVSRAAEEAAAAAGLKLQRLAEEKQHLAQEKALLQQKLTAEGEAQNQRVHLEMHIQRLTESEASLTAQLAAAQAEAGARAHEAAAARCDAALHAQHLADLSMQLQEANRMCGELDAARQSASMSERAARDELADLYAASRRHAQTQAELNSVREQLAAREAELAEAKQLAATRPQHNGLPADHKSVELSKVEGIVSALREELSAVQKTSSEHQAQVKTLQEQIATYQDKNNELRTKNWKVMEALQTAEKALLSRNKTMPAQDTVDEAVARISAEQYGEVASILRSACPTIAPNSQATNRAWIDQFAERLKAELNTVTRDSDSEELRHQNQTLQALVDKYKKIIDDTEGVLSRLQQNVSLEEARWERQLADTQRELHDLRATTITQEPLAFAYSCIEKSLPNIIGEMQNKIDSLEAELRQARANHNHTFADAERHTEERLMADLSSKHKLDSCNGPLQVDLEEK